MKPSKLIGWLFAPATGLMSRLWYWQKFAILTILFTIPVGYALLSFTSQVNVNIAFTEKEIAGMQYISPVLSLLQHVQQHRGAASLYIRGERSFQTLLDTKEREIREDIARVNAEDEKYSIAFRSADKWVAIKKEWLALEAEYRDLTPVESFTRHTKLISGITILIHTVGDNSNLILDFELPSYELMNAIINIIPALTENMGQARAFGLSVKDPEKISDEERKEFINYAKIAGIENAKLQNDMREAFENDPSLRGILELSTSEADRATEEFVGVIDKIVNTQKIPLSLPEYYVFATRVIDTYFALSEHQISALDDLFKNRISEFDRKVSIGIGITAASYLLILYFFIGFYLLTARTVRTFEDIAAQLVSGKTAVIPTLSRDELGEAGKSFNVVGQELIASNNEIQRKADELERMNKLMVGRELKMIELKNEIATLKKAI